MGKARLSSVGMTYKPDYTFCGQTSKLPAKVREMVHRIPPSLLTPASEFRGSQAPLLGLMIYLKDAENLLKSVILTVMVYYSKRKQIKISQENWYTERPEMQWAVESWPAWLSRKQCGNDTHRMLPSRGAYLSLGFQSVPGAQWTTWLTALMADFLVSSLSGSRKDTMWPRAPGKQSYSSRNYLPGHEGKDQTSKDNSLLHIHKMSKHSILWLVFS